jgi:hypothetical protein
MKNDNITSFNRTYPINKGKRYGSLDIEQLRNMLLEGFALSTIAIQLGRGSYGILLKAGELFEHFDWDELAEWLNYELNYESMLIQHPHLYPSNFFSSKTPLYDDFLYLINEGYVPKYISKELCINIDAINNEIKILTKDEG